MAAILRTVAFTVFPWGETWESSFYRKYQNTFTYHVALIELTVYAHSQRNSLEEIKRILYMKSKYPQTLLLIQKPAP
jgi:hypothetical protein